MSLLDKIESFVSKECIEMGSLAHQLIQRFVEHAEPSAPVEAPTPTPEPVAVGVTPVEQESEAQ